MTTGQRSPRTLTAHGSSDIGVCVFCVLLRARARPLLHLEAFLRLVRPARVQTDCLWFVTGEEGREPAHLDHPRRSWLGLRGLGALQSLSHLGNHPSPSPLLLPHRVLASTAWRPAAISAKAEVVQDLLHRGFLASLNVSAWI